MQWKVQRYPPFQIAQPMTSHCLPDGRRQLQWHVTDSNRPQPLRQPPPTACLTASGAASAVPSLPLLRQPSSPHTRKSRVFGAHADVMSRSLTHRRARARARAREHRAPRDTLPEAPPRRPILVAVLCRANPMSPAQLPPAQSLQTPSCLKPPPPGSSSSFQRPAAPSREERKADLLVSPRNSKFNASSTLFETCISRPAQRDGTSEHRLNGCFGGKETAVRRCARGAM